MWVFVFGFALCYCAALGIWAIRLRRVFVNQGFGFRLEAGLLGMIIGWPMILVLIEIITIATGVSTSTSGVTLFAIVVCAAMATWFLAALQKMGPRRLQEIEDEDTTNTRSTIDKS